MTQGSMKISLSQLISQMHSQTERQVVNENETEVCRTHFTFGDGFYIDVINFSVGEYIKIFPTTRRNKIVVKKLTILM